MTNTNFSTNFGTNFGIIGLGKMGGNMARRLASKGLSAVVLDQGSAVTQGLASETGLTAATSLADMVSKLAAPRIVWMMLPAGEITESTLQELQTLLAAGDTIVDGANSNYKDSERRAKQTEALGLHYMDAGVSGGVHGLANGYCLMVGGSDAALGHVQPYLEALAPSKTVGWLHAGPAQRQKRIRY
jgi:6-phosphogluconate dehydrogenase